MNPTNNENNLSVPRSDVIVKKLLRACRYFYDLKLDEETRFKRHRSKTRSQFLVYTDNFVDKTFDTSVIKLFGFTKPEISNFLAALIQPKCLLKEFTNLKEEMRLLSEGGADQREKNLIASMSNSYRDHVKRMSIVKEQCDLLRSLFYDSYNKALLDKFWERLEYGLIIEPFLRMINPIIEQTDKRNRHYFVASLKRLVNPRDIPLIFPETQASINRR